MSGCAHPGTWVGTAVKNGCECGRCARYLATQKAAMGYWPRERVAETLRSWLETNHETLESLAHLTGVQHRVIYRVLHGASRSEIEQGRAVGAYVKFETVDRLFCGLGCLHLFHLDPADGGYADLYEHDLEMAA